MLLVRVAAPGEGVVGWALTSLDVRPLGAPSRSQGGPHSAPSGMADRATHPHCCPKKTHLQLKIVFIVAFLDMLNLFLFFCLKKNGADFRGMYFV